MTTRPKVVIVTGGASGIGLAAARRFLAHNYRVAVFDVNAAALESTWHDQADVLRWAVDVADRESVAHAVEACRQTHGTATTLVNAAGIYRPSRALEITDDDFDELVRVNVRGTYVVSQIVAQAMADSSAQGAIVNVSSVAASEATDENVAYAATKGAVSSLTRGFAVSLAPYKIRVNAVAPGPIATPMGMAAVADPAYEERMLRRVLAHRFATPEDVAGVIAFLASDDADYITGHILNVDGGVLAHR